MSDQVDSREMGNGGTRPPFKASVMIVVGTRPEAIKLVPVILALRESESFEPVVISTGQHERMVSDVFELAGITTDVQLWAGDGHTQLNKRAASVMERFDDFCRERYRVMGDSIPTATDFSRGVPVTTIVHGDTSSAMAAALASFHQRIPVTHVEAGLRTGSTVTPFPEELNRQVISRVANLHFAPTASNEELLIHEDIPANRVYVTGNTGIDALQWAAGLEVPFGNPALRDLEGAGKRIVLVTAHRRENWNGGLAGIAEGLARLAGSDPDVQVVLPLHPNPTVRSELGEPLEGLDNVLVIDPLSYPEMARLMSMCEFVITDSGGIQEEAPSLGKPVLVTRHTTERAEGLGAGTLRLVGTEPDRIAAEATRLLTDPLAYQAMAGAANPYGDGLAAERIVAALEHMAGFRSAPKPFGPGFDRLAVFEAAGMEPPPDPSTWVASEPAVEDSYFDRTA